MKVSRAVMPAPSTAVTVIVAVPVLFKAGVTVTVRLVPVPEKTIFVGGTRAVLLLVPVSVTLAGSSSPTVTPSWSRTRIQCDGLIRYRDYRRRIVDPDNRHQV